MLSPYRNALALLDSKRRRRLVRVAAFAGEVSLLGGVSAVLILVLMKLEPRRMPGQRAIGEVKQFFLDASHGLCECSLGPLSIWEGTSIATVLAGSRLKERRHRAFLRLHGNLDRILEMTQIRGVQISATASTLPLRFVRAVRLDHHPGGDLTPPRRVSLVMSPGQSVSIAGPTGRHRSMVRDVLCGLVPPTAGRLTVDSPDVSEHT